MAHFNTKYQDSQYFIVVTNGLNVTPVVALHHTRENNLYHQGLEKNHKALVDMEEIASSLQTLLLNLNKAGKFTSVSYMDAMSAYKPFIERHKTFQTVEDLLKGGEW